MTRCFATYGVSVLACMLTFQVGASLARSQPTILEPAEVGQFVSVEELSFAKNRVSGVIVNRQPHPVRDVRLVIGHVYRWPSEFRPGQESLNRAETLVVEEEIPVGGRAEFSTALLRPAPPKPGGDFVTKAYIVGFTEVMPPQSPPVAAPGRKP